MKKAISLVVSLLMLLSCFSVLSVGALDGNDIANTLYDEASISASEAALRNLKIKNLPGNFNCDIRELPSWTDSNPDNDVDLLGMDLDYLYNGKGTFTWSFFDVFLTDENGNRVTAEDGTSIMKITLDDISLAVTNLNIYLQRILYNNYGGLNLYTVENALGIANAIGTALRPGFVKLQADNFKGIFGNEVPSTNEFFQTVTTLSGLDEIINHNWINKGADYCKPIVDLLGGSYIDFHSEYYTDGLRLGSKILEGAFKKLLTVGPIEYILDILNAYTLSYDTVYRAPTLDLFALKISSFNTAIPTAELNTFDGLLKLIFCNCDPLTKSGCFAETPVNVNHFCPIEFPVSRYTSAADTTERMIYLYYYFNLCGKHRGNTACMNTLKAKVDGNLKLAEADRIKINSIIDGFFLGDFDSTIDNAIVPLYKENISTAPDSIFERFKNAMMGFLKKIADYFEYLRKIFTGELQYGGGNSPFN